MQLASFVAQLVSFQFSFCILANEGFMRTQLCGALLLLVALGLISGCGASDAQARYKVTGLVTFDGKPIPEGDILFLPEGDGRPDGGRITAGQYDVELTAGPKRVEIRASRENPAKLIDSMLEPGKKVPAREDYIPEKYNAKSELKADIVDGPGEYDFDLKSE